MSGSEGASEAVAMTPKQELTLTLAARADFLTPEAVVTAVDSLIKLLKSIDSHLWRVDAPRYRWKVSAVSMRSPLTMTFEAERFIPDAPDVDAVGVLVDGLAVLNREETARPMYFEESDLAEAKRLVSIYRGSVVEIAIKVPTRPVVTPTLIVSTNVDQLAARKAMDPRERYGSVEGTLRRVTVDDREDHQRSELQIIDRQTGSYVTCKVSPEIAEELASYIRRRVILYGMVRYTVEGAPARITVENYEPLPSDHTLPTLEDIHRLGVSVTGGLDAADFIDGLRGLHGDQ